MARILNLEDAFAYLRLCDGGDDYQKALTMVTQHYEDMKSALHTQRTTLALQVKALSEDKLRAKDNEIATLRESLELAHYQRNRAREALCAHPEDEDDT